MGTERLVTLDELQEHLAELQVNRPIEEVIIHHTWRPRASDYRGIPTVAGVRRYHTKVRGWSDNGYHVMIGPNGDIFLCRPLRRPGAHTFGRNAHSIGVAYIGNFDEEDPRRNGLSTGVEVVAVLLWRFGLDEKAVNFHRDYAQKSCPGRLLRKQLYRGLVRAALLGAPSARNEAS